MKKTPKIPKINPPKITPKVGIMLPASGKAVGSGVVGVSVVSAISVSVGAVVGVVVGAGVGVDVVSGVGVGVGVRVGVVSGVGVGVEVGVGVTPGHWQSSSSGQSGLTQIGSLLTVWQTKPSEQVSFSGSQV